MRSFVRRIAAVLWPIGLLSGCAGLQSALDPAGEEAAHVAQLFWVMVFGAAVIWAGVVGLMLYAAGPRASMGNEKKVARIVLWGGAVFPPVVLVALLSYAIYLMPGLRPFQTQAASQLRIEVTARQYWWQVIYFPAAGQPVFAANEIRLPVGQRVELSVKSGDVIHSFWIPALGGKMDMIPGRTNRLSVLATKPGVFRGPCAEFCGTSHALMAFAAVTMDDGAFAAWLEAQSRPSASSGGSGAALFVKHGCGACHTVQGIAASGRVGPDLSHLGSRETLGAGILPNDVASIARFIEEPDVIKPGSRMPAFRMLPQNDIQTMAEWLAALE